MSTSDLALSHTETFHLSDALPVKKNGDPGELLCHPLYGCVSRHTYSPRDVVLRILDSIEYRARYHLEGGEYGFVTRLEILMTMYEGTVV